MARDIQQRISNDEKNTSHCESQQENNNKHKQQQQQKKQDDVSNLGWILA
jgi:hypothetical protein